MRMFAGIAAALTLASGVAMAAATASQDQEPRVWVSKDGDNARTIIADVMELADDDGPLAADVRQLAVLAGRGAQLGVSVRDLSTDEAKTQSGAVVDSVRTGSAAEKAGIKTGDVITSFDGEKVRGVRHLSRLVSETPDGRTVTAVVQRDGTRLDLPVTPDGGVMAGGRDFEVLVPPMHFEGPEIERGLRRGFERPLPFPGGSWAFKGGMPGDRGRLGVSIQPVEGQLAEYFGTAKGVLVSSVVAESPAAKAGLKAGDVITAINGKAVAEPSELIEEVRAVEDGATVKIDFTRDKKPQSATATLEQKAEKDLPRKRQSARPI